MEFIKTKKVFFILIVLLLGGYLYLNYSYLGSWIKYHSLTTSGTSYSLKGRDDPFKESTVLRPVSSEFGIIITKLGLNKKVIPNVDYYKEDELLKNIARGLVHVRASALPGESGRVLIVGQPLFKLFNWGRYNPDFYLVKNLKKGDEIAIYYLDVERIYKVTSKKTVPPDYLDFFEPGTGRKLLLVTGYPPGTAIRFTVIEAEEIFE